MAVADRRKLTGAVRDGMLAPYDSWRHRVAVYRFVKDIPRSPRHPTWQTLERIEKGVSELAVRPFQLVWGLRDWCFTPVCLERLQELIPTAETVRLEDAGHWVVEEAHEQVFAAVDSFLNRTDPSGIAVSASCS